MSPGEVLRRRQEEYEMQIFGFHSRTIYANIRLMILEGVKFQCKQIIETMRSKYNPDEEGLEILKIDEKKLMKTYYNGIIEHLGTLENLLLKILNIPKYVLLHSDRIQRVQYTEQEYREKQEQLADLQEKLKKALAMNAALNDELDAVTVFRDKTIEADSLCEVLDNAAEVSDMCKEIYQLVSNFEELSKELVRNRPPSSHTEILPTQLPLAEPNIDEDYDMVQ